MGQPDSRGLLDRTEVKQVEVEVVPPDGGFRAWVVMICCFLVNGIIFGIINTFGILFVRLKADMEEAGEEDVASKCALIGSLTIGTTFFLSFLVGILADLLGLRCTALLGALLASLGMGLSATFPRSYPILLTCYGLMFGAGSSLVYTPSLTILGHYFSKRLGLVNGLVTAGSSTFTIGLSFLNHRLLEYGGLELCLRVLTGLCCLLVLCAATFQPLLPAPPALVPPPHLSRPARIAHRIIYLDNWRNRKFVVWTLAIPLALFGYFIPYVHLPQFAKDIPLSEDAAENGARASQLIMCIGVSSGVGRVISGFLADLPAMRRAGNRVILQQISFVSIGLCTMLLTAAPLAGSNYVFPLLITACLILGLFDGCFITLLGPIAFDLCGPAGAGQAIGFLLALCSVPLTAGPPLAGLVHDSVGSYSPALLAAGIPPLVGAAAMLAIRCFPQPGTENLKEAGTEEEGQSLAVSQNQVLDKPS